MQSQACDEWGDQAFFVNDGENPYKFDPAQAVRLDPGPAAWAAGRSCGDGRCIGWSDLDFEANAREGVGVDWPIRYADIAPWYDHVERFIGVSGQREGLAAAARRQFPPADGAATARERVVRDALAEHLRRRAACSRSAVRHPHPQAQRPRRLSLLRAVRARLHHPFVLQQHRVHPARGAGAPDGCTLRPNSVVQSVIYDERGDRVTGVRVIDAETMQPLEFQARIMFLCASAMESARILLNSKTPTLSDRPGQLQRRAGPEPDGSPHGAGAGGTIPGMEDQTTFGRRPNGIYIARFRNVKDRHPDFLRGYGFQGGGGRAGWARGTEEHGFGKEFKHARCAPRVPGASRSRGSASACRGERTTWSCTRTLKDKWGIPALRIHADWGANERAMLKDMQVTGAEMLDAAGAKDIQPFVEHNTPGLAFTRWARRGWGGTRRPRCSTARTRPVT